MDLQTALARVGVRVPDVLLPNPAIDLQAWAVIACDQFTSQPEYWEQVAQLVSGKPSTLHLIFPEAFLDEPDPDARIGSINATMHGYLASGVFQERRGTMVLVRRETHDGVVRWGLVTALDLERYSWEAHAHSMIRATEGTILDRLPPRVRIREEADLELPHIMVLINDDAHAVIEPLTSEVDRLMPLYSTQLMLGGGRVDGWAVDSADDHRALADALGRLLDDLDPDNPLLFAMGDGNHSFATAKSIWENIKGSVPVNQWEDHPARYCLVELENIHDPGLEFEPIHRVLFETSREDFESELATQCSGFERIEADDLGEVLGAIEPPCAQSFGYADPDGVAIYRMDGPSASLAVGTLQRTIDSLLAQSRAEVDYIHGADVAEELGRRDANLGLFLPQVAKDSFFDSIIADGALPRKTFSLGEAADKRYYLEARRISGKGWAGILRADQ